MNETVSRELFKLVTGKEFTEWCREDGINPWYLLLLFDVIANKFDYFNIDEIETAFNKRKAEL